MSEPKTYREAVKHQLSEWVSGRPWHNPFEHDNSKHEGDTLKGECCPDFSCCEPSMLAPREVREAFARANDEARMGMLGMFLSGCVAAATDGTEVDAYVATGETGH